MLIGAVFAALMMGFLAGLWSLKVKTRWCPHCGGTTVPLGHQQDAYVSGLAPVGDARVQP
jgi:hypothetical protein